MKDIEKASKRARPIGFLVFAAVLIVSLVPWHNAEVSSAHSKYRDRVGTIVKPPGGFRVPKGEMLAMVNFRGWHGEPLTTLFSTTKHLKPGATELVVIDRAGAAWVASDKAGAKYNPRNPRSALALLRGLIIGAVGGWLIYALLGWCIESWKVRKARLEDRDEKRLMKERATTSP